jgi:hypothetical protein
MPDIWPTHSQVPHWQVAIAPLRPDSVRASVTQGRGNAEPRKVGHGPANSSLTGRRTKITDLEAAWPCAPAHDGLLGRTLDSRFASIESAIISSACSVGRQPWRRIGAEVPTLWAGVSPTSTGHDFIDDWIDIWRSVVDLCKFLGDGESRSWLYFSWLFFCPACCGQRTDCLYEP